MSKSKNKSLKMGHATKKSSNVKSKTGGAGANTANKQMILPTKPEDISSNWKAFIQVTSDAGSTAPAVRHARGGSSKSLARRATVCTCPPPVWFDGVDPDLLLEDRQPCSFCRPRQDDADVGDQDGSGDTTVSADALAQKLPQPSRYLAMDCEMVGVGHSGSDNALARVSIVNALCQPVYDKYVKPKEKVTDFRTAVSGIRPKDLVKAEKFEVVQKEVSDLLKGRILVGHALHNDLRVLLLSHPKRNTRDTANYKPFRKMFNGRIPSLKNLTHTVLAVDIQCGEHDSVQDARAAMQIYQMHRREWETMVAERTRRYTAPRKPTPNVRHTSELQMALAREIV